MIKRASWLLLIPLGIVLYIGFYLPVYADETTWKIVVSRFILDKGIVFTFGECGGSPTRLYPLSFYPVRLLNALLWGNLSSLMKVRIGGIFQFLTWVLTFYFLAATGFQKNKKSSKDRIIIVLAFCLCGVLPLGMMLNRPEQTLLIAINLIILSPFLSNRRFNKLFIASVFALGTLVLFSEHAKGIFFLPASLVTLWFVQLTKRIKCILGALLVVSALSCYQFYVRASECPEREEIRNWYKAQIITPGHILREPKETSKQLIINLKNSTSYLYNILFAEGYISDWLPPMGKLSYPLRLLNFLLKMMILLWTGVVVFRWLQPVFKRDLKQLKTLPWLLLSAIFIGLFCLMIFQTAKNAYESQFFLPILFVAGTLMASQKEASKKRAKINEYFTVVAILLAVISSLVLLSKLQPYIKGEWVQGGPVPSQPYSVSAFKFDEVARDVNELSAQCGISKDKSLKHIVVDDITYTQFWNTQEPFLSTVFSNWGDKDAQLIQFLKDKKVPGIIVRCDWMPESIKKQAMRKGKLCCHPGFKSGSVDGKI